MSVYGHVPTKKFALVIGCDYKASPDTTIHLRHAENDASAIAEMLENEMGFTVSPLIGDVTKDRMEEEIDNFVLQIEKGSLCLFYFAGHGFQWSYDHKLYMVLVPLLKTKLASHVDVATRLINIDALQAKFQERGALLNFIIIDACRGPPPLPYILHEKVLPAAQSSLVSFSSGFQALPRSSSASSSSLFPVLSRNSLSSASCSSSSSASSSSSSSSSSPPSTPSSPLSDVSRTVISPRSSFTYANTISFFACEPGFEALDGVVGSGHGAFSRRLLEHIAAPNLSLSQLIGRVTTLVSNDTEGAQIPYCSGSFGEGDIFLVCDGQNGGQELAPIIDEAEAELRRIPTPQEVGSLLDAMFSEQNFTNDPKAQSLCTIEGEYVLIYDFIKCTKFEPIRRRLRYALEHGVSDENGTPWKPYEVECKKVVLSEKSGKQEAKIVLGYDILPEMDAEESASFALVQQAMLRDCSDIVRISPNQLCFRKIPITFRILRLLEWIVVGYASDRGGGRTKPVDVIGMASFQAPAASNSTPSAVNCLPCSCASCSKLPRAAASSSSAQLSAAEFIACMRSRFESGETISLLDPLKISAELRALCSFSKHKVDALSQAVKETASMLVELCEDSSSIKRQPLSSAIRQQVEFWMRDYENGPFLGPIAATSTPVNAIPIRTFLSYPRIQNFPPIYSLPCDDDKIALIRDAMLPSAIFEVIENGTMLRRRRSEPQLAMHASSAASSPGPSSDPATPLASSIAGLSLQTPLGPLTVHVPLVDASPMDCSTPGMDCSTPGFPNAE